MARDNYKIIAPYYDSIAKLVFLNRIYQAQIGLNKFIYNQKRILVLGGGSGRFLLPILSQLKESEIYYLEASEAMLLMAQKNFTIYSNINYIHGDIEKIPKLRFDCVICHFFLDLFLAEELEDNLRIINSYLNPNGMFLVSDFHQATNLNQKFLEKIMIAFLKLTTDLKQNKILNIKESIEKLSSYRSIHDHSYYQGFIFSSAYQKL